MKKLGLADKDKKPLKFRSNQTIVIYLFIYIYFNGREKKTGCANLTVWIQIRGTVFRVMDPV